MSNFTTNDKIDNPINKIKSMALNKVDKVASNIPGYTKVKNITNKIKDAGFSADVNKDKITISYKKKF
jgi:carbon monoxide dehydrogenase subunit G|tara:strand:- start:497 stop:700 length:204 start_codon:yes stop_codon:yes gene_type:complete